MLTIAKYTLANTPENRNAVEVELPAGSIFLKGRVSEVRDVATGAAQYDMWFVVDPEAKLQRNFFYTVLSGTELPRGSKYMDTYEIVPGIDLHVLNVLPEPDSIE